VPAWFRRRQIWLPTWQGALLLVVVVAAASLIALRHLASYLADERPRHDSRRARREHADRRRLARRGRPRRRDRSDRTRALSARHRLGGPIDGWREEPNGGRPYAERAADYLRPPRRHRRSPWSPSQRPSAAGPHLPQRSRRAASGCAGRGRARRGRPVLGQRPRAPLAARLPDGLRAGGRRRRLRRRAATLRARALVDDERGRQGGARRGDQPRLDRLLLRAARAGSHEERAPVPRSPA
jgi:hypothetical protein